jgi:hypothetical protein
MRIASTVVLRRQVVKTLAVLGTVLLNDSHLALYFESLECRRYSIRTHYPIFP